MKIDPRSYDDEDETMLNERTIYAHEVISTLKKISDEDLYAYNVYQIEGEGRKLFSKINGDENTIMGLPIKKIKEYLSEWKSIL